MDRTGLPTGQGDSTFRSLHGRNLQNKNEHYLLPADGPEMERLSTQHRLITLALNSLCWPMEEVRETLVRREGRPIRVLDLGSGSGVWAVAMAKGFPSAEILGVDLSPMRPSDTPPNCQFEYVDVVNDDISRFHGMFDVVHARFIGGGVRLYQDFLWRVIPMVRPGGLFLLIEGDLEIHGKNKSPVKRAQAGDEPGTSSWFARIIRELNERVQIWVDCPKGLWRHIPGFLKANEYLVDLKELDLFLPIGWNDAGDGMLARDEVARLALSNALGLVKAVGPGLLASGVPEEEVDLWVRESEAELLEGKIRLYFHVNCYAARAKG